MSSRSELIAQLRSKIETIEEECASGGAHSDDDGTFSAQLEQKGSAYGSQRLVMASECGGDGGAAFHERAVSRRKQPAPGVDGEQSDSAQAAFSKLTALVNARDRSEADLRSRLERAGFTAAAVEEAIARGKQCGYIDDMRFAEVLIRSRISQGKGAAGISRELASNAISIESVPGWPEEFDVEVDNELERALYYLERHPTRSKNKREGAYRKLMQRGYSSSVASDAARRWSERNV